MSAPTWSIVGQSSRDLRDMARWSADSHTRTLAADELKRRDRVKR